MDQAVGTGGPGRRRRRTAHGGRQVTQRGEALHVTGRLARVLTLR
ncbi:hypothetical protein RKD19_007550 [Streptomyces canus]